MKNKLYLIAIAVLMTLAWLFVFWSFYCFFKTKETFMSFFPFIVYEGFFLTLSIPLFYKYLKGTGKFSKLNFVLGIAALFFWIFWAIIFKIFGGFYLRLILLFFLLFYGSILYIVFRTKNKHKLQ